MATPPTLDARADRTAGEGWTVAEIASPPYDGYVPNVRVKGIELPPGRYNVDPTRLVLARPLSIYAEVAFYEGNVKRWAWTAVDGDIFGPM